MDIFDYIPVLIFLFFFLAKFLGSLAEESDKEIPGYNESESIDDIIFGDFEEEENNQNDSPVYKPDKATEKEYSFKDRSKSKKKITSSDNKNKDRNINRKNKAKQRKEKKVSISKTTKTTNNEISLELNEEEITKGVIYREILSAPRALRPYRFNGEE